VTTDERIQAIRDRAERMVFCEADTAFLLSEIDRLKNVEAWLNGRLRDLAVGEPGSDTTNVRLLHALERVEDLQGQLRAARNEIDRLKSNRAPQWKPPDVDADGPHSFEEAKVLVDYIAERGELRQFVGYLCTDNWNDYALSVVLEHMLNEIDRLKSLDQWQDIATAPKGNEERGECGPEIELANFETGVRIVRIGFRDPYDWHWCGWNYIGLDPTHWRPLPDPPEVSE